MITQLDPLDMLVYLGLVLEVGESIESARLSTEAQVCFSYRYLRDNTAYSFFNRNINYASFQTRSKELAGEYEFVLLTDIADCYSRMNLGSISNALRSALPDMSERAEAIIHLYEELNRSNLYGLPIGDNPSRLVAELVMDDIDRSLYARDAIFVRYVDDYWIFCRSREEAYQHLANLADFLNYTHRLTLQSQKTKIFETEIFQRKVLGSKIRREITELADDFDRILEAAGVVSNYDEVDIQVESPEIQGKIDELGLENHLVEELKKDEINISIARFIINRLTQTKRINMIENVVLEIDKLYAVFPEVIKYFIGCSEDIAANIKYEIGGLLYVKMSNSVYSSLDYHRMQIAMLFASSSEWLIDTKVDSLYALSVDDWSRPMITMAFGRRFKQDWFRKRIGNMNKLPPWERRAFLYAASCLPEKEREGYYNRIGPKLDTLENIIVNWAKNVPINGNGELSSSRPTTSINLNTSANDGLIDSVKAMSSDDIKHQNNLLNIKKKRLQVLETQQALHGIDTPPQIVLEIDTLHDEIDGIQTRLNTLKLPRQRVLRHIPQAIDDAEDLPF